MRVKRRKERGGRPNLWPRSKESSSLYQEDDRTSNLKEMHEMTVLWWYSHQSAACFRLAFHPHPLSSVYFSSFLKTQLCSTRSVWHLNSSILIYVYSLNKKSVLSIKKTSSRKITSTLILQTIWFTFRAGSTKEIPPYSFFFPSITAQHILSLRHDISFKLPPAVRKLTD